MLQPSDQTLSTEQAYSRCAQGWPGGRYSGERINTESVQISWRSEWRGEQTTLVQGSGLKQEMGQKRDFYAERTSIDEPYVISIAELCHSKD